jgi:hypothetical protein
VDLFFGVDDADLDSVGNKSIRRDSAIRAIAALWCGGGSRKRWLTGVKIPTINTLGQGSDTNVRK